MKNLFVVILVTLTCFISSYGQAGFKPDSLTTKQMDKFSIITGKWKGEGWILFGNIKHQFTQQETVTQKVNNAVLVIDGLGLEKTSNQIVHQAFALISWDLPNKKYLMRAFRADGNYIDADIYFDESGKIIWGFTHPQAGKIKYTIDTVDGKWLEKGEVSRDGSHWIQFFEMALLKE